MRNPNKSVSGVLFLFLMLITSAFFSKGKALVDIRESANDSPTFVEIKGDVRCPAVYGFTEPPVLSRLVRRAGGLTHNGCKEPLSVNSEPFSTGRCVSLASKKGGCVLNVRRMSAFYQVTLGIPLSINGAKAESLAAVPGIGPMTAQSMVRERDKRGGFKKMADILSVPGIGPAVYEKIRPYLTL
ncbi:MAG: helix-hairpin-helix domain-containing protein [Deltaproteobacteria bacterium]|nr:helix-hairpin-helix domain-containing protein [Deltaproteobacteria bacterium]